MSRHKQTAQRAARTMLPSQRHDFLKRWLEPTDAHFEHRGSVWRTESRQQHTATANDRS
jgi:hypothetical protein